MIVVQPGRRGMGETTQWTTFAPNEAAFGRSKVGTTIKQVVTVPALECSARAISVEPVRAMRLRVALAIGAAA